MSAGEIEVTVAGTMSSGKAFRHGEGDLDSIRSDATGPAPEDVGTKECDATRKKGMSDNAQVSTEEYTRQKQMEEEEFLATGLHAAESSNPFQLRRIYGRLDKVPVINLTGIYSGHILYASSNIIVIYDFVENVQKCLLGHRNTITAIQLESKGRFFVSTEAGKRNLIIVWDTITGKAVRHFANSHNGTGSMFAAFTGVDYVFGSVGAEEAGKQTFHLWNFAPNGDKYTPIVTEVFPRTSTRIKHLAFVEGRPEYFAATADRSVVFGTWVREANGDSVSLFKPRLRKAFITKYRGFTTSVWMRNGEWLATATGSGFILIWGPPIVLGLEDPPDPSKNVKEYLRSFKLCESGISVFKIYKEYVVIGDETGVVRIFDLDFKLLRWSREFNLPSITSVSFSKTEHVPDFKDFLRQKYISGDQHFPASDELSRVKEYTRGGQKFRQASKTTLTRPPMVCPDFVIGSLGGDVYYYHFHEAQLDKLVCGTPGPFVSCDACPGSNHVAFITLKGDLQLYDYTTHALIFSDKIFAGNSRISTMKFHPFGQICAFGLKDGKLSFRWSYTWKTSMSPMSLSHREIIRIIFSIDGLHLAYFDRDRTVVVLKYLPKGHGWMVLGKSRAHFMKVVDLQFFVDEDENYNRLFSLSVDRHLIEYDIDKSTEDTGLWITRITKLEETARPTAMVFNGPTEYGLDCFTFANDINKLRIFSQEEEKVRKTCCGPVFGREEGISRLIAYPYQVSDQTYKTFIMYIVKSKIGLIDTPIDGNPHKYMAIYSHPTEIMELSVLPTENRLFTVGRGDNAAYFYEVFPSALEATLLMGGTGITPFYHTIKKHWGGACQDILKDLEMIFFFFNVKRIDKQIDLYTMNQNIRLCEIPAVCRACGFFPSEYEVGLMIDEARELKQAENSYTDDVSTDISLNEFVKLFGNHFYRTTDEDVEEAFKALGFFEEDQDEPYVCKHDFQNYLTTEGEKISTKNFPIYFDAMYELRKPGEFGQVKCHTVEHIVESSSSSGSGNSVKSSSKLESDWDSEYDSSSSSFSSDEIDDADLQDDSADQDEEEEEEEDDDEEEEEEEDDEEEEEEGSNEDEEQEEADEGKEGEVPDVANQKSEEIIDPFAGITVPGKDDKLGPKQKQVIKVNKKGDALIDLPERIDLSYFLDKMLPLHSQQTIRWRVKGQNDELTDEAKRMAAKRAKEEQDFLKYLLKQIVDSSQPVPPKFLHSLYAQHYLEKGNFDVPPEIRYPGITLPGDNWYGEDGELEAISGRSSHSSFSTGSEPNLAKQKGMDDEEEEVQEEGGQEYPEILGEGMEFLGEFSELENQLGRQILEKRTLFLVPDQQAPTEDETTYSPAFSTLPTTAISDSQQKKGSYDTDATEEMTDLENVYEGEDLQFVKKMSERPSTKQQ